MTNCTISNYRKINLPYKTLVSILIYCVISLLFAIFSPFELLLNFTFDDAFFYIKPAYNFACGFGSTFDNLDQTNGYHPLWFLLLVIFFKPILFFDQNITPENLFRATFLLHNVIVFLIIYISFRFWKYMNNKKISSLIILIILLTVFVFIRDYGMESHINCLIVSVFLLLKVIEINHKKDYIIYKTILLCLLFLGRLDYVFPVIVFIIIGDTISDFRNYPVKKLFIYSISLLITVSIYIIINYIVFNSYVSTSARLLNSFPDIILYENISKHIYQSYNIRLIFIISTSLISISIFFKKILCNEPIPQMFMFLNVFSMGLLFYIIFTLSFNKEGIREWYLTMPFYVSAILFCLMLKNEKYNFYIVFLLVILTTIVLYKTRFEFRTYEHIYKYSKRLESVTSKHDFIYQIDFTGIVGYFSNRNIVNGDGLINSTKYYEVLSSKKVNKFIREKKIKYLSTYTYKTITNNDSLYIDTWLQRISPLDTLILKKSNIILKYPFIVKNHNIDVSKEWLMFVINLENDSTGGTN